MNFTSSIKWSFLSELAAKAIQPVSFIILARLLTPEDFGVMTAAMMIIAFSQIFWEAGMGKALIQRQDNMEAAANVAFIINIGLGCIIALLLHIFSEPLAEHLFQDSRVTLVLKVMVLQVFLGAFGSVQTAIMQKEMLFKELFWVRLVTVSLPAFGSILLAWQGWGYWALVFGALIGQFAQVLMLWHTSSWRPGLIFDKLVSMEVAKFGGWVALTGLLTWSFVWADSMIIGYYLGIHDLGLFNTGGRLPAVLYAIIFGPVLPVMYSHISRVGSDSEKMKFLAEIAIVSLTLIAIPTAIAMAFFSQHIELVIFGQNWLGVGIVVSCMALMHGYSWIAGMNGEFYRAMGKPSYEAIIAAVTLPIYLVAYILVVKRGLDIFVITRAMLAIGALFLHLTLLQKILKVEIRPIIKKIFLISFFSILSVYCSKSFAVILFSNIPLQLVVGLIFSALLTIIAIFISEKNNLFVKIAKLRVQE